MSTTPVAQPHHLRRKAVIYIRQSTGHQVLTNPESQQLQHAMREHARHLGWPDERIEVVETDLGRTAQSTDRRDGYKALLAEVALGQVGIVLSYESTRLSRNCTDWYPLLDLCAYNQCLDCGSRWRLRCRDPQWPALVGDEGDRERGRAPHLARPPDRGRAAEGAARRLGPGPPGRSVAPRRWRRRERSRPGGAACD